MNKRGFTLIELLAVIVILAIIALIATPIVLSIINQSKESARLRSAEMYLKGVETSVASAIIHEKNVKDGTHPITPTGDICLGTLQGTGKTATCDGEVLEVQMNGEVPTSGTVKIGSGKITDIAFTYSNGKTIVKKDGKLVYEGSETSEEEPKKFADVCTYVSGTEKIAGAKYSCEVKEGTSYNFYVLTTPKEGDTTINLIMDQNINSDGTPAGMTEVLQSTNATQYNLVTWFSKESYVSAGGTCPAYGPCGSSTYGPIDAMQFLYNATKNWTNIEPINYTYNDRNVQGITSIDRGYQSFVVTNGAALMTPFSGTATMIGSEIEPLRARLPIYSNNTSATEVSAKITTNEFLYDNLKTDNVGPNGYWTLSTGADGTYNAYFVNSTGNVGSTVILNSNGVRPVITLKLK